MSANPYPVDAAVQPDGKPWRVTAHRLGYWGNVTRLFVVGDFRWYWQANAVSWFYHHVLGYGCNTWRAASTAQPVDSPPLSN
jgi:hypothetical protein